MAMVRIYMARKETTKALEIARAIHKRAPDDPEVNHTLGRLAFAAGDRTWGFGLLQESARKLADNPDVQFDYAEAALGKGDLSIARDSLQEAQKSPNRAQAAKSLLGVIDILENGDAQPEVVSARLKLNAEDAPALVALGVLQERKGDLAAARSNYEKALKQDSDFAPGQRRLTHLNARNSPNEKEALEVAVATRSSYPADAEVAKDFGLILYRQRNFQRAVGPLEEAARKLPQDGEVLYYLGLAQFEMKDADKGKASLQKALRLSLRDDLAAEAKKKLAPTGKR
jgi:Flp pilus assembly protein TadD